jgi:Fic family protein
MSWDQISESIIKYLKGRPPGSSREIYEGLGSIAGYATIKRRLAELVTAGSITVQGRGRATRYALHESYSITQQIDADQYFRADIDAREARSGFNHELMQVLGRLTLFTPEEEQLLAALQARHTQRVSTLPVEEHRKEMQRLAIDLSWKSSQIEGNTYSLLETERLLKEKITAEGKTLDEAAMLLNHKEALDFITTQPDYVDPLSIRAIEDIHSLLVRDLGVSRNLRERSVGISGTRYRPLDNAFQIREAMEDMCRLVNRNADPFAKALLLLLLVSYIQPFTDGNKRTARIISNALLMAGGHCPLSFRTVDPLDYKKAMLIFYEQNNISAFKKIFIEQVEFAVNNYF